MDELLEPSMFEVPWGVPTDFNMKQWFTVTKVLGAGEFVLPPQSHLPEGMHAWSHRGKDHLEWLSAPVVREMKTRPGIVVSWTFVRGIHNSKSGTFQVWTQGLQAFVIESEYGIRCFWKHCANGKESLIWGWDASAQLHKTGIRFLDERFRWDQFGNLIPRRSVYGDLSIAIAHRWTKWEQRLPITKWLLSPPHSESLYVDPTPPHRCSICGNGQVEPFSVTNIISGYLTNTEWMMFTSAPGVKGILNNTFDKKGIKRIPKNAFGGVGEIREFDEILGAIKFIRVFKDCNPHVFVGMKKDDLTEAVALNSKAVQDLRYILNFFKNNDKAVSLVYRSIIGWQEFHIWTDTVMMMKLMRSRIMREAIRDMLRRNPDITIHELHDHLATELNRMKTPDRKITSEALHKFDGHQVAEEIISVTPKTTHDLVRWGSEYNICIGGYADRVLNEQTLCFGFAKPDGTFWGFAEVTPSKRLQQLLGKHNSNLPEPVRSQITDWLTTQGVDCSRYIGLR